MMENGRRVFFSKGIFEETMKPPGVWETLVPSPAIGLKLAKASTTLLAQAAVSSSPRETFDGSVIMAKTKK
jgi:hypothetical protein